jgi:3-phenylpropionate/trans-cinnamate dioxygenase ferredoxin subunit
MLNSSDGSTKRIGQDNWQMGMGIKFFPVAEAKLVPIGSCGPFEIEGRQIVVAHFADGYYAIENRCSHAGSPLNAGDVYHGRQIACPLHGARFDIKTGAAKSPPAFRAIATFPTRITNGKIEIGLTVSEPPLVPRDSTIR